MLESKGWELFTKVKKGSGVHMASIQWEYRLVTGQNKLTEEALNSLGVEGWELVGVTSHVHNHPTYGEITEIVCVFKRQKQTEQTRRKPGVY